MDQGSISLGRRRAATIAIAGLAQATVLWVVVRLAHWDLLLLVVLEIAAGLAVALAAAGWPRAMAGSWTGAMAGALIGGTAVVATDTSLTGGQPIWAFVIALVLGLLLFTPGYLIGSASAARGESRQGAITPATRVAVAVLILAAGAAAVVWAVATVRIGP